MSKKSEYRIKIHISIITWQKQGSGKVLTRLEYYNRACG